MWWGIVLPEYKLLWYKQLFQSAPNRLRIFCVSFHLELDTPLNSSPKGFVPSGGSKPIN